MREAPFILIGEGTSEIQKTIISRGLLKEYKTAEKRRIRVLVD